MPFLEKGLLLYLCFAIACSFAMPTWVFGNQNILTSMFNINSTNITTTQQVGFGANELNQPNTTFKAGYEGAAATQFVVDPLGNVIGIVGFIFRFLFSPFIIFYNLVTIGAPVPMIFIFAMPVVFLVFWGIIVFIRSGFS